MAKKNKKNKGKGGAFGKEKPEEPEDAGAAASVKSGAFCFKSSLGVPFLVVSDGQLVAGLPKPNPCEFKEVLGLANKMVKEWAYRGAVLLADFEGEFTGLEGELISAAFQRTWAVDPKGLRQMPCSGASSDLGLLVDLRSPGGIALCKRLMESDDISKVIWGADGDVTCLRYTPVLRPLGIESTNIVDAQLAFSSPKQRLAMAKMLERVPPESIEGLPSKEGIDFDTPHAFNRRALPIPLGSKEATYAVDDLHRLDAILRSEKPKGGSYIQAQGETSRMVSMALHNIAGASANKLQQYERMLEKKEGLERQAIAVRVKRHLMALRRLKPEASSKESEKVLQEAEKILADASVSIPEDLSFLPSTAQAAAVVPCSPIVGPAPDPVCSPLGGPAPDPALPVAEVAKPAAGVAADGTQPAAVPEGKRKKRKGKKRRLEPDTGLNLKPKSSPDLKPAVAPAEVDDESASEGRPREGKFKKRKKKRMA